MAEIISMILCFVLSTVFFIMSIFSFNERGVLFNNAWLFASEQERADMDKKPYYRQSAVVFLLIGTLFLLNAIDIVFETEWISYAAMILAVVTVVYAIVSSVVIGKRE